MPIQKAGAIVLSTSLPRKALLLFRQKEQDWTFPKGHVEEGEGTQEAAEREVKEETGLSITVLTPLAPYSYQYPEGGDVQVHMYLAEADDTQELLKEFDGDDHAWVTLEELPERLSYDNLKSYLASQQETLKPFLT